MDKRSETTVSEFSNSIDKTLSVIDCIFQCESTFNTIQKKLNLPKATLHRILQSLEKYEYIEKTDPSGKYRLGLKFVYYGESVKSQQTLPTIAEGYLKKLALSTGESSSLTVLYQEHCMSLVMCHGEESALTSNLLPFPSLNCSASGKLFLSTRTDEELKAYFTNQTIRKLTLNTITTYKEFKEEQKKILEGGISFDDEENEYGLYCMSVPLYNHTGQINANIGITAPKSRLLIKNISDIENEVRKTGKIISDILTKTKCECPY